MTRSNNPKTTGEDMSVGSGVSGMTSKSKTQLAVRQAKKDVSVEHNKAMEEQQQRFQREIDRLRKALENSSTQITVNTMEIDNEHPSRDIVTMEVEANNQDTQMIILDTDKEHSNGHHSPSPKRPKRAKSRTRRGRGGSQSTPHNLNE
jgi:S-adenosylmethionine synthetase